VSSEARLEFTILCDTVNLAGSSGAAHAHARRAAASPLDGGGCGAGL